MPRPTITAAEWRTLARFGINVHPDTGKVQVFIKGGKEIEIHTDEMKVLAMATSEGHILLSAQGPTWRTPEIVARDPADNPPQLALGTIRTR